MKQIRLNVFETNSSSTHSLVMAEDSLFQKWIRGELFYVDDSWRSDLKNKQFLNKEEFFEVAKKYNDWLTPEKFEELLRGEDVVDNDGAEFSKTDLFTDLDVWPYDDYCEYKGEYLESSEYTYITPEGEKIRALAFYGYDG